MIDSTAPPLRFERVRNRHGRHDARLRPWKWCTGRGLLPPRIDERFIMPVSGVRARARRPWYARSRRPLTWSFVLLADQGHRAGESLVAQGLRGFGAGQSRSDDQVCAVGGHDQWLLPGAEDRAER